MVKKNKAIFFDRDGVLIKAPVDCNNKPVSITNYNEIEYIDHICDILKKYRNSYYFIMITNQPDVTRKKNTLENVKKINDTIKDHLKLDEIFVCYCDDDKCNNRKPNTGMLLKAKERFSISMENSYFIGDRWRDVGAAKNIGCNSIFIDYKYNEQVNFKPDFIITNLKQVENIISE